MLYAERGISSQSGCLGHLSGKQRTVTAVLSRVGPNLLVSLTQIFGVTLPGEGKSTLFALLQPDALQQSANFCDRPSLCGSHLVRCLFSCPCALPPAPLALTHLPISLTVFLQFDFLLPAAPDREARAWDLVVLLLPVAVG